MFNAANHVFGYHLAWDVCAMPEIDGLPAETFAPSLQEGLRHHAGGRLAEAARCYQRAYDADPEDADALLLLGIVARQGGNHAAAVQLTALAAKRRPDAAHIYFNLALALFGSKELETAREACRHALQLDEGHGKSWALLGEIELQGGDAKASVAAYVRALKLPSGVVTAAQSLGNQLCREGRYEEGLRVYRRGLAAEPENAAMIFSAGAARAALGKTDEAKQAYLKALKLRPHFPEAHLNLGNLLFDAKNFRGAAMAYARALKQRPDYAKAHCNLGNALSELGNYTRAVASYERALELDAETLAAHHNLGNALLRQREYARAEKCFRHVLEREPNHSEYHNSLGNALMQQQREEEAEVCYHKALSLKPDYAAAHINLANTLLQMGRLEEMNYHYQRGVELDPASAGGQYNLALTMLRAGEYAEGWLRHEWRFDFRELRQPRRGFSQPQWRGEELNGATILLHAEQGLGDTLHFVRYAPLVAERGGRVFLEVQPRLQRLLEGMAGVEQVMPHGNVLPQFAWHCPLMSLPLAFHTRVETIPAHVPYLRVPDESVGVAWRTFPRIDERLRVGLAWAGNPKYKGDRHRSIALSQLEPLADLQHRAIFYSLQFGQAAEQIEPMHDQMPVIDACSQDKDFADTAAVAATLDLVISVDTSIAHLAGGMGLPVWVLLAHQADWRWMDGREDSPWYPTARLFRQPAPGDWVSVIAAVRDALDALAPTDLKKQASAR
jgi:tetratricopeptide (TPR) repeat protein